MTFDLFGAKYQSTGLATSVLPSLGTASPNAVLAFTQGELTGTVSKLVNVSATNVVTKFATTVKTFSLTLTAGTGKITGTFPHTDGITQAFLGIIYQKTGNADVPAGAHGYFLTVTPRPVNGLDASGKATLMPNVP